MKAREGIGSIYREKLSKVVNVAREGITPELVAKTLEVDRQEAGRLLSRWESSGWVRRIKRGFYVSLPLEASAETMAIENPWIIVSKIFSPGYIAGFSAIKHWDLSEQIFETVIFFTTKKVKNRTPRYAGISLRLKTIDESKVFGTKTVWIDSIKVKVSDPSKTIVDLLDDPTIGGGMTTIRDFFLAYLESAHKDIPRLIEYAAKMDNDTIFKRLGFLFEITHEASPEVIESIKGKISKGYSKFDPSTDNVRIIRRWNLKVPAAWASEYDREK